MQDYITIPWPPFRNAQRKQKQQARMQAQQDQYGFILGVQPTLPSANKFLNCLLRGILIFLGVITPIDMLSSAFDIPYQPLLVVGFLLILALLISMINYHWILRAVGLIVFFIVFVLMTLSVRRLVNSGFNAIINIITEYASYELNTESIRTYDETISNRALTIPVFYIFVGSVSLIFLNFILNNFMSATFILICAIPFWTLSFYFDIEPKPWHFISYAFLLMTITILKHCNQYNLPDGKAMNQFRHNTSKKKHDYLNISNGKIMIQTGGFIAILLAILLVLSSVFYPAKSFYPPNHWRNWKASTEDSVRILVSQGLGNLLFQNEASGGLSYGMLGAGKVSPDFETDFIMTLAPAHYDNVYVRSFIGTTYTGKKWDTYIPLYVDAWLEMEDALYNNLTQKMEGLTPEEAASCGIYQGKIRFEVKTDYTTAFMPYQSAMTHPMWYNENYVGKPGYTDENDRFYGLFLTDLMQFYLHPEDHTLVGSFGYPNTYETIFYDFTEGIANSRLLLEYNFTPDMKAARRAEYTMTYDSYPVITSDNIRDNAYTLLDDVYLDVIDDERCGDYSPTLLKETLIKICEEQNFHGTAVEIIVQVMEYLENNFYYSMNPGKPAKDLDFVTNFLTENNYGYCAHFASAATLLLRTMGLPTRYVEGYVITFDDMTSGTILEEENYQDWLWGDYQTENSAVISVEVPDASAHAWVEVYFEGLGWVPIEMTNAAIAEPEEDPYDFWNNANNPLDDFDTTGIENLLNTDLSFVGDFLKTTLLMLLVAVLIGFVVIFILRSLRRDPNMKPYHQGYAYTILKKYRQMIRYLQALGYFNQTEVLHSDFAKTILEHHWLPEDQVSSLQCLLDTAGYSANNVTSQDVQTLLDAFQQIKRSVYKECKHFSKVKALFYRYYFVSLR